MRDVFVCHSTEDRAVANALVESLEAEQIPCWIAPRDIMPGADYAEAIVAGISVAKVLVLVFSRHSNLSPHVAREVERAVSRNLPIIPYRIEDVEPVKSLEYFISSAQWLDATTGDPARRAAELAEVIRVRVYRETGVSSRDFARESLRDLINRYGTELPDDPRRLQALLRDVAGEHRLEVAVLFAAAEEGVGEALLKSSQGLTPEVGERLVRRLQQNRALAEDASRWAVEAWGYALGIEAAAPTQPPPEAVDQPQPPPRFEPTVGMAAGARRLPATPPLIPPRPSTDRSRRNRIAAFVASGAAVVLLIGGVAGWVATRGSEGGAAFLANEVFLELVGVVEHPFTSNLLATGTNALPGPPTTLIAERIIEMIQIEGSHELSYSGDRGSSVCDAGILLTDLREEPVTAGAWAEAQGIDPAAVADFVAGLTPMLLTRDARVTSHVLDKDRAVPRQVLLQEGTAVLVGPTGEPRVRCESGSPLNLPVTVATPTYVGTAWPGFDPAQVVEILPCEEPITEFVLRDAATGEPFARQTGSDVTGDTDVTITTVAPTTTTVASTTTTTTSTTTTTLPVADHDATGEGTVSASSRLCGSFSAAKAVDGNITTSWISSSGDGAFSTFDWTGSQDEFIGGVTIISNAANATASRRTNHGFASVTIQVIDAAGDVVYEEDVELPGTLDPDVFVRPNVAGRSVRLLLTGHENSSGSGFAELIVLVTR